MAQMGEDRRTMFLSSPLTHCRLEMARVSRTQADPTVTRAGPGGVGLPSYLLWRLRQVDHEFKSLVGLQRVLGKPGQQVRPISK